MKTILYSETLDYYDGVQVFGALDTDGEQYVGMMVDTVDGADRYLVTSVTSQRMNDFRSGALDLRTLLLEGAVGGWYLAHVADDFADPLNLEEHEERLEETDFLPEDGFFLNEVDKGDSSVDDSAEVSSPAADQGFHTRGNTQGFQFPHFSEATFLEQSPGVGTSTEILVLGVGSHQPDYYETVIKPTIERAGYLPMRIEIVPNAAEIRETIQSAIARASCLVVYFAPMTEGASNWANLEISYATGLGRPVLLVCQDGQTSLEGFSNPLQYALPWRAPAQLRDKLEQRILTSVGYNT